MTPAGVARAGHQGERPDALSVVDADYRPGRKVPRPEPERPEDVARRADFDDAIVELVGDENVAGFIEVPAQPQAIRRGRVRQQQHAGSGQGCPQWPRHARNTAFPGLRVADVGLACLALVVSATGTLRASSVPCVGFGARLQWSTGSSKAFLRWKTDLTLPQYVVTAPSVVVASPGGAHACIISSKIQALTLVAPSPVRLPREIPAVMHQIVVAATGMVVRSAGRTVARVIAGKVHSLTLMTPLPVGLPVGHRQVM